MKNNIFTTEISNQTIERINQLSAITNAKWGKMNVGQMLAHCNVTYEMVYTDKYAKPNAFVKFILKNLVKNKVVSDKPFSKNGKTAPQFVITDAREFDTEKKRLVDYINQTQKLGEKHFNGLESYSFGELTAQEWNNMFYKHLNHHLSQFGV